MHATLSNRNDRLTLLLIGFVAAMQFFTFSTKLAYGRFNTTALATLPVFFVGILVLLTMFRGAVMRTTRPTFTLLDGLVFALFLLDFIEIFNPYLGASHNNEALIIGLRGFQQRSFFGLIYFVARVIDRQPSTFGRLATVVASTSGLSSAYAVANLLFDFNVEYAYRESVFAEDAAARLLLARRAIGFLGSPFTFGMMSAFGLLCGIHILSSKAISVSRRILIYASVFINAIGILLSGSRSTYLALSAALLAQFLFLPINWKFRLFWGFRWALLTSTIAIVILVTAFPDTDVVNYATDRVQSLRLLNSVIGSGVNGMDSIEEDNFAIRYELACYTLPLILERPIGYGTGIFTGGANKYGEISVGGVATWIDNEFSALAMELGLPGIGLFITIVALLLNRCRIAIRMAHLRKPATALMSCIILCPISGLGGQWLTAFPANCLFWVFAGVAVRLTEDLRPIRTKAAMLQAGSAEPEDRASAEGKYT